MTPTPSSPAGQHQGDFHVRRRLDRIGLLLLGSLTLAACASDSHQSRPVLDQTGHGASAVPVDPSNFIRAALVEDIRMEERELADGTRALCYIVKSKSVPHEHEMGPWSPTHVTDGKDKGGIWMKDGVVYDVDGPFIAGLAELYDDPAWQLVRADGSIRITETKAAFEAAARPDVDPAYHNHVVEGRPEWIDERITTYVIPVQPVLRVAPTPARHGAVGVAFNGVNFDPPAPLHAILAAHTIAPLDDSGGHLNPHSGYHYHAATGHTKEVAQADGHAPMLGYALDGFAIYAHMDENGEAPQDLDECGGHTDAVRGYHYHAGSPGSNRILTAFRGVPGTALVDGESSAGPGPRRRGQPGPADRGRRGPPHRRD